MSLDYYTRCNDAVKDSLPPSAASTPRGGFSLASLVLLVTVLGVLLASADFRRGREEVVSLVIDGPWRLVALVVGAAIVGCLIGLIHMFVNGFSWRMLILSPFSGALAAELGLMILVAPGSPLQSLLAVVVVLGTTMLLRLDAE